jgi:hypothetical protein
MRIKVLGENPISSQARTYAEHRVFAAIARSAERVRSARVVLRALDRCGGCEGVACTVTVALEGRDPIRIRTTGAHAYAAINRATIERTLARDVRGTRIHGIIGRVLSEVLELSSAVR